MTLTEQYEKTPIAGAELSLHYIATVGINTDGQLNYIYTDAFAGTDIAEIHSLTMEYLTLCYGRDTQDLTNYICLSFGNT